RNLPANRPSRLLAGPQRPGGPRGGTRLYTGACPVPARGRAPAAFFGAAGAMGVASRAGGVTGGARVGGATPQHGRACSRARALAGSPQGAGKHVVVAGGVSPRPRPSGAGQCPL